MKTGRPQGVHQGKDVIGAAVAGELRYQGRGQGVFRSWRTGPVFPTPGSIPPGCPPPSPPGAGPPPGSGSSPGAGPPWLSHWYSSPSRRRENPRAASSFLASRPHTALSLHLPALQALGQEHHPGPGRRVVQIAGNGLELVGGVGVRPAQDEELPGAPEGGLPGCSAKNSASPTSWASRTTLVGASPDFSVSAASSRAKARCMRNSSSP